MHRNISFRACQEQKTSEALEISFTQTPAINSPPGDQAVGNTGIAARSPGSLPQPRAAAVLSAPGVPETSPGSMRRVAAATRAYNSHELVGMSGVSRKNTCRAAAVTMDFALVCSRRSIGGLFRMYMVRGSSGAREYDRAWGENSSPKACRAHRPSSAARCGRMAQRRQ